MEQELGLGWGPARGVSAAHLAQSWSEGAGSCIAQPPAWGSRVWQEACKPQARAPQHGQHRGNGGQFTLSQEGWSPPQRRGVHGRVRGMCGAAPSLFVPVILC